MAQASLGSRIDSKGLRLAQAQAQATGFKPRLRLRLKVLNPGSGSGSQLFEPRLARLRLRLGVFEPMDNISHNLCITIIKRHY